MSEEYANDVCEELLNMIATVESNDIAHALCDCLCRVRQCVMEANSNNVYDKESFEAGWRSGIRFGRLIKDAEDAE